MTRVSSYAVVVVMLSAGVVACDYKHSSTSTSPSSIANGAAAGVGSLLGVWSSGSGGTGGSLPVPDPKSCSNFQWSITQQTGNAVSGTFSAVCMNAISLSGTANGQLVGTSVPMVVNGTATLPGLGNCTFTINGTGYVEDSGNSLRIPYNATTCIGPFSGEETLRRPQPAAPSPTPTPNPPAPPPPPPPPPPASPDQIDLNTVQIMLGPNVATWPQTSTVTSTVAVDHQLCIYHTKLGQWPSTIFFDDPNTLVEGNQWIFANINGQWYAGAGDWYRPGQACKDVTPQTIAHDAFYSDNMEPLRSWVPQPGEVFGLMASTPARAWPAMRTVDERSNVVLVRWGQ
jgi:hypothetical protein